MKRLVRRDKGIETWCHFTNDEGAEFVFETRQTFDRPQETDASLKGNTQRHQVKIAEVPETLYHHLRAKYGDPKHNPTDWKKWLNDHDNRFFRTNSLRV